MKSRRYEGHMKRGEIVPIGKVEINGEMIDLPCGVEVTWTENELRMFIEIVLKQVAYLNEQIKNLEERIDIWITSK